MFRNVVQSLSRFAIVALASLAGCADFEGEPVLDETSDAVTSGSVVIQLDPGQRIHHGFDIKQPGRAAWLTGDRAREIFGENRFDLIRIPVYARTAHPGPDRVTDGEYQSIVNAVQRAQRAAPGVQVFASLRLEGPNTFPGWVLREGHVEADDFAHLLMDFLQFMQRQGVTVDYLGPDNEAVFNEGEMNPARFTQVVQSLAERCRRNGVRMPQIVGNDEYSPALGTAWLDGLRGQGHLGLLDVAGVHYYSKHRTLEYRQSLVRFARAAGSRPVWDTEFHWNDTERGAFYDAKIGLMTALDNTDAGVRNITWWAYNPRSVGTLTAHLHNALVDATVLARPLPTRDHDGAALGEHRFNTRAFLQGEDVTLIVVNDTNADARNRRVELPGHGFDRAVTFQRWSPGSTAGTTGTAERYPRQGVFTMDFPSQTITFVRIPRVR